MPSDPQWSRSSPRQGFRVPPLPAKTSSRRFSPLAIVVVGLFIALLVYSWLDVQGSLKDFVTGWFSSKGLIRDILPHSSPPQANQFWDGFKAAMTTLAIAVLSIVFGLIFSVAMIPLAARNLTPSWRIHSGSRA